jgi:hypothetical protein
MGYGIIGDSRDVHHQKYQKYHDLMSVVAKQNNLELQNDIRPLTAGGQQDMMDYLVQNQNKTLYSIMFCHEFWREKIDFSHGNVAKGLFNFSSTKEDRNKEKSK